MSKKFYTLYKNSTKPDERTLVHEKVTRKDIVDLCNKKAKTMGAEFPAMINDTQMKKFLSDIDYDLIIIESDADEDNANLPSDGRYSEEKFVYNQNLYLTSIKIGRRKDDKREPVAMKWVLDQGFDVDSNTTHTDVNPEHEPSEDFIKLLRDFDKLVLTLQDFLVSETIERMTVQSVSIKWHDEEYADKKELMGMTISYVIHHPELSNKYSCGNTPFMLFDSYLENNDDKTGQIGISRAYENQLRKLMLEAQKYLKGKYAFEQKTVFEALEEAGE